MTTTIFIKGGRYIYRRVKDKLFAEAIIPSLVGEPWKSTENLAKFRSELEKASQIVDEWLQIAIENPEAFESLKAFESSETVETKESKESRKIDKIVKRPRSNAITETDVDWINQNFSNKDVIDFY